MKEIIWCLFVVFCLSIFISLDWDVEKIKLFFLVPGLVYSGYYYFNNYLKLKFN